MNQRLHLRHFRISIITSRFTHTHHILFNNLSATALSQVRLLPMRRMRLNRPHMQTSRIPRLLIKLRNLVRRTRISVTRIRALLNTILISRSNRHNSRNVIQTITQRNNFKRSIPRLTRNLTRPISSNLRKGNRIARLIKLMIRNLIRIIRSTMMIRSRTITLRLIMQPIRTHSNLRRRIILRLTIRMRNLRSKHIRTNNRRITRRRSLRLTR